MMIFVSAQQDAWNWKESWTSEMAEKHDKLCWKMDVRQKKYQEI